MSTVPRRPAEPSGRGAARRSVRVLAAASVAVPTLAVALTACDQEGAGPLTATGQGCSP